MKTEELSLKKIEKYIYEGGLKSFRPNNNTRHFFLIFFFYFST